MKKIQLFSILLLASIFFFACESSNDSNDDNDSTDGTEEGAASNKDEALTFTKVEKETDSGGCEESVCYKMSLVYPQATGGVAADSINSNIVNYVKGYLTEDLSIDLEAAIKQQFENFNKDKEEGMVMGGMGYEMEMTGEVTYQSPNLISLEFGDYQYFGGAHPNTHTANMTFDAKTGKRLDWKKMIDTNEDFMALLDKRFREARKEVIDASTPYREAGFDMDKIVLPDNIGLNDKGLVLNYNPYEIAPYVLGPTTVEIDFESLKPYIPADSPLANR